MGAIPPLALSFTKAHLCLGTESPTKLPENCCKSRNSTRQCCNSKKIVHAKILVTRIAATSKSQIASDCNRNSKNDCDSENTLWSQLFGLGKPPVLCGFYSVSEAPHGSGNPPEYVATTRVRFWIAAIFLAQCDFCDCDTAIFLRFLREKLATSKLWLPIASDLWLRLRVYFGPKYTPETEKKDPFRNVGATWVETWAKRALMHASILWKFIKTLPDQNVQQPCRKLPHELLRMCTGHLFLRIFCRILLKPLKDPSTWNVCNGACTKQLSAWATPTTHVHDVVWPSHD